MILKNLSKRIAQNGKAAKRWIIPAHTYAIEVQFAYNLNKSRVGTFSGDLHRGPYKKFIFYIDNLQYINLTSKTKR